MMECFRQLIATPSVSCIDPRLDQGNRGVVDLLAGWLADFGFSVELMPVSQHPDKCNLIARLGSGAGRVYTVSARVTDLAGNTATATGACTVPHDQGK